MNARMIVHALGGRNGMARCPAHKDRIPSLHITDGHDGRILVHCHAGCRQRDVIDALKARGLWPHPNDRVPEPSRENQHIGARPSPKTGNRERAIVIWRASRSAAGTEVEIYLRGRGITIPVPPSTRFHPNLKHVPTGLSFPAMVSIVQGPDGTLVGVHRTYLRPGGRGKADVTSPRMSLGPIGGGAVRLAPVAPRLALSEGIETALSVQQATGMPAWAALSTSGLKRLVLPPEVREVIIFADGDEPGEAAAAAAAEKFSGKGRKAFIARPPKGKDFNEVLPARPRIVPFKAGHLDG